LRKAETTNALLAISPCDPLGPEAPPGKRLKREVQSTMGHFYECIEIAPRLSKLKRLLEARPYEGKDEGDDADKLCTFEELLEHVQAAPEQIREELTKLGAFQHRGIILNLREVVIGVL